MRVAEVLAGRAGLAGVQWLLLDSRPRQTLRRELERLLADGYTLGRCYLRRAKFKSERKLSAYFDVELHGSDGRACGTRPVAVTWTAGGHPPPVTAPAELQQEAIERGLAAPFRALEGRVGDSGPNLLVSPLDAAFPHLIALSDPEVVADVLGAGGGLRYTVRPIRYRPGQRHVLRYDPQLPRTREGSPPAAFARLYDDDRGSRSLRIGKHFAEVLAGARGDFRVAPSLAYLAAHRALLSRGVPGAPLSRTVARDDSAGQLRRVAAMLRSIHAAPLGPAGDEHHELEQEIAAVARATGYIAALAPTTGVAIRSILQRAQSLHARLPRERPVLVHGDFKLDHLWVAPGALTVIDFDRCCAGDPALDVGKMLADLRWWYAAVGGGNPDRAQRQFVEGYFGEARPPRLLRARVYEALLLLKIAAHRVQPFDARWQARIDALVSEAERALVRAERDPRPRRRGLRRMDGLPRAVRELG